MSESERRRKYRWNRVLIETDRLFNPQYDDAVVYLTGAQIEMLRNVTQNLRRLDTYVTEYAIGYYLAPTVEEYDSILEIVSDLEEVLMGNPNTIWGYKDRFRDAQFETSIGDAYTDCVTDAVPEGLVHVVEHWTIQHLGDTTCSVDLYISLGGGDPVLYTAPNLPSADRVYQLSGVTLKEGDTITFRVWGLPNTKTMSLYVWGHTMVVP